MDQRHSHPLSRYSLSRRRLLAGAGIGSAGIAAAALIGCSAGSGQKAGSSQAAVATATVGPQKPKSGGTIKYGIRADADSLDPYRSAGSQTYDLTNLAYSRMFSFEVGDGGPASGKVQGDLAKTWEQPDPLTLVVRLDPAAKFDQKEPLNGRSVTANDVVQSWTKFAKDSVYRSDLSNAANPDAPFVGVEAIDDKTVKFKLKFADATALSLLAWYEFWIEPAEGVAGKIDLAKEMRGSGPFLLDEYKPAVGLKFKRNAAWHGGPEMPYADGVNVSIIPDVAQMEAQFRAKNLHFNAVSQPNVATFAKELSGTEIVKGEVPSSSPMWGMGLLPGSPWNDVRVRRAISMGLDRDQFTNVIFNPKPYEALGIKLSTYWNAPFAGGYGTYWMDPKGSEFGPSAGYLKYNPDEATKLLQAAGYGSGRQFVFDNIWPSRNGEEWVTRSEVWQAMLAKIGVKMNVVQVDYQTDYVPNYFRAKAEFKGKTVDAAVAYPSGGNAPDAVLWYLKYVSVNGASSLTGKFFPYLDQTVRKIREITDFNQRVAAVKDLSRYATDNMVVIPVGPYPEAVNLVWKGLRGPQQFQGWLGAGTGVSTTSQLLPRYWFQGQI